MTDEPQRCADCGLIIEWYPPRDRWAAKILTAGEVDAWSFTCRTTRNTDGLLIAADYHHPADEQQHHFRTRY